MRPLAKAVVVPLLLIALSSLSCRKNQPAPKDAAKANTSDGKAPGAQKTNKPRYASEQTTVTALLSGRSIRISAEVVRSEADRAYGLMFRKSLAANAGMLFVFDSMRRQSFWMKNTYIPLDIIFIDDNKRVVGIAENTAPLTLTSQAVDAPSIYVLEVNARFCRRHGIKRGTQLKW